jgi:2-succinyl-5-enolpyruvyl-6-hydroxy-3-cyclohexene-1-carboxylate synthase
LASGPQLALNPRAALELLIHLQRLGLRHLVLCPGSRSAPLAVAAALLEPTGVRLVTAIDERSAAFFALGLGRATGWPAAVITTSGSAVANLLPAAVEADHGTIPLLLLTADRPARLKGCGANQSVNQEQFLACSCRWLGSGDPAGLARMAPAALADLAERAMAAALGNGRTLPPGAVHLNLPFDEPLHADGEALRTLGPLTRRALASAAERPVQALGPPPPFPQPDPDQPGVVVAGPWRGAPSAWPPHLAALRQWQRRTGWPVLADELSGLRGQADLSVVGGYDLVLEQPPLALAAPQLLRLGSLPASRRLQHWIASQGSRQWLVSDGDPRPLDPLGCGVSQWSGGLESWLRAQPQLWSHSAPPSLASRTLALAWQRAEERVQTLLDRQLAVEPEQPLREPWLARQLSRLLPADLPLMLANSSPVRDWESFADPGACPRTVFGFRGASGIDGTLSIACGLADALGALVLVTGDLALLHDSHGWLWRQQLQGRLTVLLIDNGGGGIFEQLPIRTEPETALDFERLFAMPQHLDPLVLAAAHGVPGRAVERVEGLEASLHWALAQPIALVRLMCERRGDAALRRRLRTMAAWDPVQP